MPDLVAAVTPCTGCGEGTAGSWGHGATYQTQTGGCGSWRGLARRAAPHKFARCNNEIDVRAGDGVGGASSGEGTLGKR